MPTGHFAVIVIFALAILLMGWNARRIFRIRENYGYEGGFQGPTYACLLGSADSEHRVRCVAGADRNALYLMAAPRPKNWWLPWKNQYNFRSIYPTDLRIPWEDVECNTGRIFFNEVIWFKNEETKFYVYLPREIGEKVMIDAGRAIPL